MSDTMSSPSYIQTVRLEPQAAPTATSGAIGWMRKNLFSSVLNAVLTVLAIAVIVVVVIHVKANGLVRRLRRGLNRSGG